MRVVQSVTRARPGKVAWCRSVKRSGSARGARAPAPTACPRRLACTASSRRLPCRFRAPRFADRCPSPDSPMRRRPGARLTPRQQLAEARHAARMTSATLVRVCGLPAQHTRSHANAHTPQRTHIRTHVRARSPAMADAESGPWRAYIEGNSVRVVDTGVAGPVQFVARRALLRGHGDAVNSVCFSLNHAIVASVSNDETTRLWNTDTHKCEAVLNEHASTVHCACFSLDGTLLASGSSNSTVLLWDVGGRRCRWIMSGHADWVLSVCFSPDGQTLASTGRDKTIHLWQTTTGACKAMLCGHDASVNSVCFSRDGLTLASASDDRSVRVWDPASGECRMILNGHDNDVNSVCISLDMKLLASGSSDQTVRVWSFSTGVCLRTLRGPNGSVMSVSFAPDSQTLAAGSGDADVHLYNVDTGVCWRTLSGHTGIVRSVCFSPDGALLASGADDNDVLLWETTQGVYRSTLSGHCDRVTSVCFWGDDRTLVTGSEDACVRRWDFTSGECMLVGVGHTAVVTSVCVSQTANVIVSGSRDTTVRFWHATNGTLLTTAQAHGDWVIAVTASTDGSLVASVSSDRTVRIWNAATFELVLSFGYDRPCEQWRQYADVAAFLLGRASLDALESITLSRLCCDGTPFNLAMAARLGQLANARQYITQISLNQCGMNNAMVQALVEPLAGNVALKSLDLRRNPISVVPPLFGSLSALDTLDLDWHGVENVPRDIVKRGWTQVRNHLYKILREADRVLCHTKIMLVGHENVGKTSLARALNVTNWTWYSPSCDRTCSTIGIDVTSHHLSLPSTTGCDARIEFSVWDFGGQEGFYDLHALFLSHNAIYVIVWDLREPVATSGVNYWLQSIRSTVGSSAPVILVATHRDDSKFISCPENVTKQWRALQQLCPEVEHLPRHEVCSVSYDAGMIGRRRNHGISRLREQLYTTALKMPHMNSIVPTSYLAVKHLIVQRNKTTQTPMISITEFTAAARSLGISDETTLQHALAFLHDQGVIIYHGKQYIVTQPQWFADLLGVLLSEITIRRYKKSSGVVPHAEFATCLKLERPNAVNPWIDVPVGSPLCQEILQLFHAHHLTCTVGGGDKELIFALLLPGLPNREEWPVNPATAQSARLLNLRPIPRGLYGRAQSWLIDQFRFYKLWRTDGYGSNPECGVSVRLEADERRGGIILTVQAANAYELADQYAATLLSLMNAYPASNASVSVLCPHCVWYGHFYATVVPPAVVNQPPEQWSWQCGEQSIAHEQFISGRFATAIRNTVVDAQVPRRMLLLPDEQGIGWSDPVHWLGSHQCRLYLLCEAPDECHLPPDARGFKVLNPLGLIRKYGKHIVATLQLLNFAISVTPAGPIAGPILSTAVTVVNKLGEDPLLRFDELVKKLETTRSLEDECAPLSGSELQQLARYLDQVDPLGHRDGLQPVMWDDGYVYWMCGTHYNTYCQRQGERTAPAFRGATVHIAAPAPGPRDSPAHHATGQSSMAAGLSTSAPTDRRGSALDGASSSLTCTSLISTSPVGTPPSVSRESSRPMPIFGTTGSSVGSIHGLVRDAEGRPGAMRAEASQCSAVARAHDSEASVPLLFPPAGDPSSRCAETPRTAPRASPELLRPSRSVPNATGSSAPSSPVTLVRAHSDSTVPAESWGVDEVVQWLQHTGLQPLIGIVRREHIDGVALGSLSEDDWARAGAPLGARRSIMRRMAIILRR